MIDPDKARKQRQVIRNRAKPAEIKRCKGVGRNPPKKVIRRESYSIDVDAIAWSSPGGRGCT